VIKPNVEGLALGFCRPFEKEVRGEKGRSSSFTLSLKRKTARGGAGVGDRKKSVLLGGFKPLRLVSYKPAEK